MEVPKFTDFLVTSHIPGGTLNPQALDRTLNQMGAALIEKPGTAFGYLQDGDCYVMRVFGDPGFVKFACEHQGYCKIVGERQGEPESSPEVTELEESVEWAYHRVAQAYADRIELIFESELKMREVYTKVFPHLTFDRTDNWSSILYKELEEAWRSFGPDPRARLTTHDRFTILDILSDYLDFNIYSQVALNLQDWSAISYRGNAKEDLEKIAKKWDKYSMTPLNPRATMIKNAFRPQDVEFNKDLSVVKSLRTISGIDQRISFRVTPRGHTPALADSQNFSTIGIGGDQYVCMQPGYTVWYICWSPGKTPYILEQNPNGSFRTKGIQYDFTSSSGGQILNEVLFSRAVACAYWTGLGPGSVCLPRMNSVMVVTKQSEAQVRDVLKLIGYTVLELVKDRRMVFGDSLPTDSAG